MAWWPDEQPSDEIKHQVEEKLEGMDWEVDVVLTHVISMPEKDKMVLEEICKGYKIKVEDLVRQFYLWVIREPEAAAQWLNGETERKKV